MRKVVVIILIILISVYTGYCLYCRVTKINVKDFGAKGDGITNDTAAIQRAVNACARGGTVYIPDGTYKISAEDSIHMKSNVTLNLSGNATLQAQPTSAASYSVVYVGNVSRVKIVGGKICGEKDKHIGTEGQWGMGIKIYGSKDVHVSDIFISNCWGDGIHIDYSNMHPTFSQNVTIERFKITDCLRSGICISSAKDIFINDGLITDCKNDLGMSNMLGIGINLETDEYEQILQNININNVHTEDNGGWGMNFCIRPSAGSMKPFSVNINNYRDTGSASGGLAISKFKEYIGKPNLYNVSIMLNGQRL